MEDEGSEKRLRPDGRAVEVFGVDGLPVELVFARLFGCILSAMIVISLEH